MNKKGKIISACTACAAALGLGICVYKINSNDKTVPTFSSVEDSTAPVTEPETEPPKILPDNWADNMSYVPSAQGYTGHAKQMLKQNQDVVGWITLDHTVCDYPVVLDPGEIPEGQPFYVPESYDANYFYLDHDLDGSYKFAGSLYFDYRDVFGSNEDEQSENLVIYGHDMADNSMFGNLRLYRQDYDFYNTAPFIQLSSNYKNYEYVIFAALLTSGIYDDTDFRYWNMEELDTEEDFNFYVDRCNAFSLIDTGVDVKYGDKLLTLSTCSDDENIRFIVVARRLRDGEKPGDMASITHTEEYIREHTPQPDENNENDENNEETPAEEE